MMEQSRKPYLQQQHFGNHYKNRKDKYYVDCNSLDGI